MAKKKTTTKKATTKKPEKKKLGVWETLSVINCNEWVEKKGKFDYLSWTHAWSILMKHYPDSTFFNHLNEDGYPCFFDAKGNAMVRVSLTVQDVEHTEDFAITDNYNNSILFPDSSDVNTALKRCLVKAMAWHGLGSYIYSGSDLPEYYEERDICEESIGDSEPKITKEMMDAIGGLQIALRELDGLRPKDEVIGWNEKNIQDVLEWYLEMAKERNWKISPETIDAVTLQVAGKVDEYE
jgi:hypothetical protein